MNLKIFYRALLYLLVTFCSLQLTQAQDLLKGNDLSRIKVDQLSDADIAKFRTQLNTAGVTIDQAEQAALSKGMPASEFAKLRQRLGAGNSGTGWPRLASDTTGSGRSNNSTDTLDKYKSNPNKPLINPLIFGSELYTSVAPSFEPNMSLATPVNYILGPNDELQISVYGVQEFTGSLLVSSEGSISVPNVGEVKIAGMTIEAATQKLRTIMGNSVYPTLRSGSSKLSITLSKIRSIKVTIIGASRPGNFNLSSLSTVFNALYVAGGPTAIGSFREIELVRNNKPERKIDLYRLLLHGDQSDNIALKDNDVIRIPPYKKRIELQGQVKRPGIFEVLPGENLTNILDYASGFTDTAYQASLKVYQRSEKERKVQDLESSGYVGYQPQTGDIIVVSKISNRFENRVKITGAVYRPDVYELRPGLRVADLIRKADGLKEDAFTDRGQIMRLEEDLTRSIRSFDIRKALRGDTLHNILLVREDEIVVSSVLDLRDSFKVTIQGEIRIPGKYDYVSNLTLKDLILQAGGFTDAAYKNIEIARLVKRDSIGIGDNRASTIINTEISGDLSSQGGNIELREFDVITIRRKAGYTLPESVIVSGQVQYPGPYALSTRNEKVSDILRRAGGYTPDAYPEAAYLKRYKTEQEKLKIEEVKKVQRKVQSIDTLDAKSLSQEITRDYDQIPLDLTAIMKSPGTEEDLVLKARDELYIPKFDAQVKVTGSVLLVTQVPYRKENAFKDYISEAGGYSGNAWRRKAYVVYANGRAATAKHFLFFKFYPKVLPGSEVIVPVRPERKSTSLVEIVGLSSTIASLVGVVIALIRL